LILVTNASLGAVGPAPPPNVGWNAPAVVGKLFMVEPVAGEVVPDTYAAFDESSAIRVAESPPEPPTYVE